MCCCFGHSQLKSVCLPCSTSFCMLVFTDISSWHCLCTSHVQQHCYQMFGAVLCNFPSMHMIIFIHVCIRLSHDYIYIQCIHNKYIHTIYIYIYTEYRGIALCRGAKRIQVFPSPFALLCTNPLLPYRLFTHHSSGGSPTHSSAASNQQTPQSQIHIFPASHGMNAARFCSCCKHLVAHSACILGDYALWLHVLAFSCMSW